jgi:hypothetical protein
MMKFYSIEYALLAIQSALLREITPELRAVIIDLDAEEKVFYAYIYYDGKASEKMIDLWDCAIGEAGADLGRDCFIKSQIKRLDYPNQIPQGGYCAYMRKEDRTLPHKPFSRVKIKEMSIGYALLAVQNALLEVVTPALRTVIVDFKKEGSLLYIRFFYDGKTSTALIDLWQSALARAKADFGTNCILDGKVERLDYPNPLPLDDPNLLPSTKGMRYAYVRKE